jgi:hypothetical protein
MVEPIVTAGTVNADEHEQLRRSYAALQDQFDAANEVLSAVGRSAGDADTADQASAGSISSVLPARVRSVDSHSILS